MRIVLLNPPSISELIGNNPSVIESERGCNPPLGLLYVAAYLREHGSHEVLVVDAQVEELGYAALEQRLAPLAPFDVVGMTVMTFTLFDVMKTLRVAKKVCPQAKGVLGGPHASIFPEETCRLPGVDYVVHGEGEIPFAELVGMLGAGTDACSVKGIAFLGDDGEYVDNGVGDLIEDLDSLPFPARDLTPYSAYGSILAKRLPITTIFTSRGCPFKCSFCDRPHLGKQFRSMGAARVIEEIECCIKMGIHEFLVYDDTFTVDRRRVLDICKMIIERGLDIGFDIRARVDTMDEEMLHLLKLAGCRGVHYGIESGSEKILKVLKKGISLEKARQVLRQTKKEGIQTLAYFMIGCPTETRADIEATFRAMKEMDPDFLHLTILTPFPSTPLYLQALEEGVIDHDYWREFAANPQPSFSPPFWDGEFSRSELEQLIRRGYRLFYMRPVYMFKTLLRIESLAEFKRKAKAGIRIALMSFGRMNRREGIND